MIGFHFVEYSFVNITVQLKHHNLLFFSKLKPINFESQANQHGKMIVHYSYSIKESLPRLLFF